MRITAGSMRGRMLCVPNIKGLRPTPSRVREALFNIIGNIQGFSVLDLFAGSGVMSLEALSRGAKQVLSIEADAMACKAMQNIQTSWGVTGWTIQQGMLLQALPSNEHFDFIYADPPYAQGLAEQVPVWLNAKGITFDTLVVEEASRTRLQWKAGFLPSQSRKYSETTLYFFHSSIEVAP